ncbi:MAG: peptidase domain-containing ABC transporter, partial [Gammaproteobacteria bacterium]|nr:peptidase domain-containing ABC transporter [Gammaproteobacteria bacterium]
MSDFLSRLNFSWKKRVPVILQSEVSECGLACLAMIAGYYGHDFNLTALRQRYPVSSRGMNMQQIALLAQSLKLDCQGYELALDELNQLKMPCILHWDLNHYVVLISVTPQAIQIIDPAIGMRTLTVEQVSDSFTGYALTMYPRPDFSPIKDRQTISLYDFWKSLHGIGQSLGILFALTLVLQIWGLLNPLLMRFIVDDVLIYKDTALLLSLCVGFALMTVFSTVTSVIRSLFLMFLTKTLSLQVQNALFGKLIRLPLEYFIKRQTGDILSRFSSLQSIQSLVTTTFVESTLDGLMMIVSLSMMLIYAPMLSLVTIFALLCYITVRALTMQTFKEMNEELIAVSSKERSAFLETLHSVQPIKIFHKENQRQALWQSRVTDAYNVGIRTEQFSILYSIVNKFIFACENILILYFSALMIIAPNSLFSLGMMYAFLQYKQQFSSSVSGLVDNYFQLKMIDLHLERVADIALEPSDRCFEETDADKIKKPLLGGIGVKDLSFQYDLFEPFIFDNISFSIEPGESVALVGPSGCGKSTLMKVLISLLIPQKGKVMVDDTPLDERSLADYRDQIACVMQNDSLMSGSIRQNIGFFEDNIDDEWVEECAKIAAIHNDIMNMPSRYETYVGELGSQISGGQQQRILIARALYKKPKILFLDEATSHLDIATEHAVSQAISELKVTR